jgi:citrate synthase
LHELSRGHTRWTAIAQIVADCVETETGMHPNIDFYAGPVLYQLGFPVELFTNVVASARVAGWAAHALEQYGDERPARLRADYIGPRVAS